MTSRSHDLKNPDSELASEELQVAQVVTKSQYRKMVSGAPIYDSARLPPEIMLQIFQAYDDLWQPILCPPRFEMMARVKPVIHTCSIWRALALKWPSFWSVICTDWTEDFMDWMLMMGGDAPLKIQRYSSFPFSRSLMDNIWRLRQLGSEHSSIGGWFAPIFATMVANPAQCNLETLSILPDRLYRINRVDAMLPDLLRVCAPTLHRLCLTYLAIPMDCLHSLVHLGTLSLVDAPLGTTTIGELIHAISISCPCIDTLVIVSDSQGTSSVPARRDQKPHFPCLKRLCLSLNLGILHTVMDSLDLPPDCCLRLSQPESDFSAVAFDSFQAVMLPILQNRGRICRTAYLALDAWDHYLRFIADDASQDIEAPDREVGNFALAPHWPSIDLELIIPSCSEVEPRKHAVQSFVCTVAVNCAIVVLHVAATGLDSGDDLWPYVAAFDGLDRLRIEEEEGGYDADCLAREVLVPLNGGGARSRLLAPKLRVLEISLSRVLDDPHSWHECTAIKDFVRRRQECGVPLERFLVETYNHPCYDESVIVVDLLSPGDK